MLDVVRKEVGTQVAAQVVVTEVLGGLLAKGQAIPARRCSSTACAAGGCPTRQDRPHGCAGRRRDPAGLASDRYRATFRSPVP